MEKLKRCLLNAYGRYSGKHADGLGGGDTFVVEGRGSHDPSACTVSVTVKGAKLVGVCLRGRVVPVSDDVRTWVHEMQSEFTSSGEEQKLEFLITPGSVERLAELACAVGWMVHPNAPPNPERAYDGICPRVARALGRLQGVLEAHWESERMPRD